MAKRPTQKKVESLWEAYEEAISLYGKLPALSGIDIGLKYTKRKRTKVRSIRFHLKSKKQKSALTRSEIIPARIKGIVTDVLESNYQKHWSQPGFYRFNPQRVKEFQVIQPGISIGDDYDSCGTLGLIVKDKQNANRYALTAAHVLPGKRGEDIFQPAAMDSQDINNQSIGKISRKDLPLDVALVLLDPGIPFIPDQFESNVVIQSAPKLEEYTSLSLLGKTVFKSGRTTGMTMGIIDGIGKYEVDYGVSIVPVDANRNNIEISYGGDSGALWYDENDRGIGIQVIGENNPHPSKERAIASALPAVMHYLNIDFI